MATGTTRSHLGEEQIDLFIYGRSLSIALGRPDNRKRDLDDNVATKLALDLLVAIRSSPTIDGDLDQFPLGRDRPGRARRHHREERDGRRRTGFGAGLDRRSSICDRPGQIKRPRVAPPTSKPRETDKAPAPFNAEGESILGRSRTWRHRAL
jgi:hypothetical protein